MKTKVKLISGDRVSEIEKEVNDFIQEKNIDILDLKMSLTIHMLCCSIVYKEKEHPPTI